MDRRRKEEMEMSDRHMIYELLEEAHQVNYPNYTFGSYLKAINYDIGPLENLPDDEIVRRLSGYISHPFKKMVKGREDLSD